MQFWHPLFFQEMADVQEQLRDVMFYLEAQNKLATVTDVTKEEIQDGQIIIGASGGAPAGKKPRKKGRWISLELTSCSYI